MRRDSYRLSLFLCAESDYQKLRCMIVGVRMLITDLRGWFYASGVLGVSPKEATALGRRKVGQVRILQSALRGRPGHHRRETTTRITLDLTEIVVKIETWTQLKIEE